MNFYKCHESFSRSSERSLEPLEHPEGLAAPTETLLTCWEIDVHAVYIYPLINSHGNGNPHLKWEISLQMNHVPLSC